MALSFLKKKALEATSGENSIWMALFGSLLGLSAPGFNLWGLAWLALAPALLWAYQCPIFKKRAWGGFWFGFCFQALYCIWFFDLHPLTWLGFDELSSRLVTLAGWLLICAEGGFLTSLFFGLTQRKIPFLWRLIGLPMAWIGLFSLLNATPLALPWGLLEYTQAGLWPMRWMAAHGSGLAITILLLGYAVLMAECIAPWRFKGESRWPIPGVAGLLSIPLILMILHSFMPSSASNAPYIPMPVGIIQGNLPIEQIRSGRLSLAEIEPAYLTPLQNAKLPADTLVLLPEEGVIPGLITMKDPQQNPFLNRLTGIAQEKKFYIAVGVSSQASNGQLFNSIALISPEKSQPVAFYHKRRLVPFGEYTPYHLGTWLSGILGAFQVDYSAPYQAGTSEAPLQAGNHKLGGLVCFELIDSFYAQRYQAQRADMLINVSNLGWFHQNPLLEAQFLAIGQLRAAEVKMPLAIASNTGISAILSETGEVLRQTGPFQPQSNTPSLSKTQLIFYNKSLRRNYKK